MREVLPGIHHWTRVHPAIRHEVSSYWLSEPRVLLDPLVPDEGLEWFEDHGSPRLVLLTSGLHVRASAHFARRFGCPVRCPRQGLTRHEGEDLGFELGAYDWGEELPGGIIAFEIDALCPDEAALVIPRARAAVLADGAMREGDGPLGLTPDELLGADDPEAVKRGLRGAFRRLLDEHDVEHLLLAHGEPIVGGGARALRELL